jgi:hypothetical protein
MRKTVWFIGIFFGLILAAHAQSTPEREIYTVLHYGDNVFAPDVWLASATEEAARTTATWTADSLSGLAYADYLHFDDGIQPDTMSTFFNDAWFEAVFTNYQGFRQMNRCTIHDITLYEFTTLVHDQKYMMRYWIEPVSDTRILALFLVFPTKDQTSLDEYAIKLFPTAVSCEAKTS